MSPGTRTSLRDHARGTALRPGHFERIYKALVDEWRLYDNSGSRPVLIDAGGSA
jgi:hypothetical protein